MVQQHFNQCRGWRGFGNGQGFAGQGGSAEYIDCERFECFDGCVGTRSCRSCASAHAAWS